MNKAEYDELQQSVESIFTSLYMVDAGSLTPEQRKTHQEELSAAYLAFIRLENAHFADITDQAKKKLDTLATRSRELQEQLTDLKKAKEILEIVSGGLDVLKAIAELLK